MRMWVEDGESYTDEKTNEKFFLKISKKHLHFGRK